MSRRVLVFLFLYQLAAAPAVLAQYRFDHFTTSNGLPQNTVSGITQTPDGYLWFSTYDGLVRYDGVRFRIFDVGNTPAIRSNQFLTVFVDAAGTLWASTGGPGFLRYRDGAFETVARDAVPPDASGEALNDRWRAILRKYGDEGAGPAPTRMRVGGEDRHGGVWLFNDRKLIRYADGAFTSYDSTETLHSPFIRTVFCDREGTVWVGTNDNGLYRVTRQFLTTLGEADGLASRIVYPILEDRAGTMWFGSGQVLTRFTGGRLTPFPVPRQVRSFHQDREGRLWMGTGAGVLSVENGAVVDRPGLAGSAPVNAILQDRDGAIWFGSNRTVVRLRNEETRVFTASDGVPEAPIEVLLQDRQGRLWAGSGRGLARLDGDRWTVLTTRDGLTGDRIRSLYEDKDGVLWVGTFDSGLSRIDRGRITNYTTRTGLFNNGVFQIFEDERGNLWIGCNRGIYRVSRRELNEYAAGKRTSVSAVAYGTQDGMLSAECNGGRQPAGVKARDGRLWFPTQNGVVVIDPEAVTYNTQPPVLTIESVVVDRADAAFRHGVELSPGQSDLEINYSAPSSVKAEHIQFKYKLEGLEDGWIEAGSRRTVHYSHLSPGSYVFRLTAANSDGVWNETGTTLAVRVKPHFYQTGWFMALCLFGVVGTGSGGYAWRIQQLKANEKRLTQLVAERTAEVHERGEQLKVANAMLADLATTDPLTNVANRRRFTTFLNQEWQRAQRTKSSLSLLLIDVDHFKAYNDSSGHQAGDDCLRKVGGVLNETVQRAGDLAARYGGEEFAVILSDTDANGALAIAETIRQALETAAIPHAASPVSAHVTASIGVATAQPDPHSSPDDLVAACDRALYRAKELGRNRCVAAA